MRRGALLFVSFVAAVVLGGCDDFDPELTHAGSDAALDAAAGDDAGTDGGATDSGATDSGAHATRDTGTRNEPDSAEDDDAGDGRADGGVSGECDGPLLPMAVGNTWTYRVTHPGQAASTKRTTIDKREPVGGSGPNADKLAFHVVTTKQSGSETDTTVSWQAVLGDKSVVRYREVSYKAGTTTANGEEFWQPYKLRVDESADHVRDGAAWTETYTETKLEDGTAIPAERADGWSVDGVDVPCGPVRGHMLSCIKLTKKADGASAGKTYLYARCVGKVREEGAQTEELTDYTLKN